LQTKETVHRASSLLSLVRERIKVRVKVMS